MLIRNFTVIVLTVYLWVAFKMKMPSILWSYPIEMKNKWIHENNSEFANKYFLIEIFQWKIRLKFFQTFIKVVICALFQSFSTVILRNQIYSEPFKMAHSFRANQFKACGFLLFHFHFVFRKCVVHFFVRSFKEVSQKQARNPDMKQLTYSKISRNAGRHH